MDFVPQFSLSASWRLLYLVPSSTCSTLHSALGVSQQYLSFFTSIKHPRWLIFTDLNGDEDLIRGNLPVKWLGGTKPPCNLPSLDGTQFYSISFISPHPPRIEKISSCQSGVHVSISAFPPHHSGPSHSVGHAVSERRFSNQAAGVGSLPPVDGDSRCRLCEMNIPNPVESFNAFKPWLQHE